MGITEQRLPYVPAANIVRLDCCPAERSFLRRACRRLQGLVVILLVAASIGGCNDEALSSVGAVTPDLAGDGRLSESLDQLKTCSALFLPGTGSWAESPSFADPPASLTLEAWVYLPSWSGETTSIVNHVVGNLPDGGADTDYEFYEGPGEELSLGSYTGDMASFFLVIHPGGDVQGAGGSLVPVGKWFHVAGVYDSQLNGLEVFVDGQSDGVGELKQSRPPASAPIRIGSPGDSQQVPIYVSEVRMSSIARYTQTFIPEPHLFDDLDTMALFHLDENSGITVRDSSSFGRDASLFGSAAFAHPPSCR